MNLCDGGTNDGESGGACDEVPIGIEDFGCIRGIISLLIQNKEGI